MKSMLLMPGLQVPRSAPPSCQKKAKEQVKRFRSGERNYKQLHAKGKHKPGSCWMKIDIGGRWRLLSRNNGDDWELLTTERYNTELWK
ncbi:hypothetical protein [Serratia marcescens]|uniref:ParE family toxin-like protein n=1 Tax=Serratia marcescens TaxID=615 RepID=UPI000DA364E6|nr:hypothetical protein [Serratia marcescens]MBU3893257.1 hypothetical protein [Serratia rubidaea]SQJ08715.1 Uncharacterised protein [Serratia rubidaea]